MFALWPSDLSIFDLRFGFYVKNPAYSRLEMFGIRGLDISIPSAPGRVPGGGFGGPGSGFGGPGGGFRTARSSGRATAATGAKKPPPGPPKPQKPPPGRPPHEHYDPPLLLRVAQY